MHLDDFDFELPESLIAQYPAPTRDGARLMIVRRAERSIGLGAIPDLRNLLEPGDLLVVNDTRVRPARLLGRKPSGGRVEAFLVQRSPGEAEIWRCLTRSSKGVRPGQQIDFPGGIVGEVLDEGEGGERLVRFTAPVPFEEAVESVGRMPLPPYIRREDEALDRERYQTVYATAAGAVAAPTAGLHFTPQLLAELAGRGIGIAPLTLHVGIGTFAPIRSNDLTGHRMHAEEYRIPAATVEAIRRTKAAGGRVVAVGTTSTRALESAADAEGRLVRTAGSTDIFIKPGDPFRVVDALITNFHLPRTTLLVLVAAFAGRELTLAAYRRAVEERFRFFSYGDCMLIL